MSYVINRTNKSGERLVDLRREINKNAESINDSFGGFDYYERCGSVDCWLELNRERAKEILACLDKIEEEFIENLED